MSLEIIKRLVCDDHPSFLASSEGLSLSSASGLNAPHSVCGDADHITDRCPACAKKDLHSTMLHVICTDLNKDMEMHIGEATGKWHLDPGKLVAAIERHGMSLIQGKGDK